MDRQIGKYEICKRGASYVVTSHGRVVSWHTTSWSAIFAAKRLMWDAKKQPPGQGEQRPGDHTGISHANGDSCDITGNRKGGKHDKAQARRGSL